MKVQTKLVYWNTLLFTTVFIVISILFLITYSQYATYSIFQQLKNAANISAIFHLEEDELAPKDFAHVKDEYKESVSNIYYQVYADDNSIKYGLSLDTVPNDILDTIRTNSSYYFTDDYYYAYGIFYRDNEGDFVIVAKEKKELLQKQQETLIILLSLGLLFSSIMVCSISKLIAYRAFKPFRDINKAALDLIDKKKKDLQLVSPNSKDELDELIIILNKLLKQLEETFIIQKNFVRYVTHEFKTPIAAIRGNLEVFSIKDRTPEEYRELCNKLIDEVEGLNQIINTLLAISDIHSNNYSELTSDIIDLGVLIQKIIQRTKANHSNTKLIFVNECSSEEDLLIEVACGRTQITMALSNLIENAAKYSNGKDVTISLSSTAEQLKLIIRDNGIGIPKEQLEFISKPFYRADNASYKAGSGIGLSIALRILEKNNIKYKIESVVSQGTTITILFT